MSATTRSRSTVPRGLTAAAFATLMLAAMALVVLPGRDVIAEGTQVPVRPVPSTAVSLFEIPVDSDPSYLLLDNVVGDWVNVVAWSVRPMAFLPSGNNLYAVNVYHNTIGHFDATLQRIATFRTLWAPVSIATYVAPGSGSNTDQLLVVCQLSNAVVVHNRLTGDVIDVIDVPPQPADILVVPALNRAFVSTLAKDVVVEIDLLSRQIVTEFAIPSRQPTYLSLTPEGEVLVAPRWSGNNSVIHRKVVDPFNTQANSRGILNLADPLVATPPGLPDEDLFWLNRGSGQAVAIARGMGTLLFGHGVNPQTDDFWQLNTEANNKDPLQQSEPAIKGFISKNRLTRVQLPALGSGMVVQPSTANITDLDLANPTGDYDRAFSVGSPYSLTFTTQNTSLLARGTGFLTGLLTDNVVVLDSQGSWIAEWDLPPGCIPRQVLLDPSQQFAAVYCSGLNRIRVYALNGFPPSLMGNLDLGHDPTPESVRKGRRLFFDASHSLNNNHSCATCHDEGRQDMLAWNLSNGEFDDKGPMVTQTLVGINRAQHFHWRGEQQDDLLDFNEAFINLLGGTPLATGLGSDFENFEAFVLSLEHPANPFQNAGRILDDGIQPPLLSINQNPNASAIAGRALYVTECETCHNLPTGSSNDIVGVGRDFGEPRPKRQWTKTSPLLDVINKGLQTDVSVQLVGTPGLRTFARLGQGLAHAGNPRNIFHFNAAFFPPGDPRTSDVNNFLFQFDSGLAPAAHAKRLMNMSNVTAASQFVSSYMIAQANSRNCDLAVFGRTTIGGVNRIWGWYYNRANGRFLRDDNVYQQLAFFNNRATNGDWFVFVGQPVGMGPLFAIDFDRDDFPNGLEQLSPVDGRYVVDTDGDGDWDGHEWLNGGDAFNASEVSDDTKLPSVLSTPLAAAWTTAKVGRLSFETDELTTYQLKLVPTLVGQPTLSFPGALPRRQHSVVMASMFPSGLATSNPYSATLTVTDQANNSKSYDFTVTPRDFHDHPEIVKATDLGWGSITTGTPAGSAAFTANVNVSKKTTLAPAPDELVIGKVLVDGVPATASLTASPNTFCVNGTPYTPANHVNPVLGPFVISQQPTDANGDTALSFTVSGLTTGDVVTLVLEVISPIHPTTPICPGTVADPNLAPLTAPLRPTIPTDWSFPDTEKKFRSIAFTYP